MVDLKRTGGKEPKGFAMYSGRRWAPALLLFGLLAVQSSAADAESKSAQPHPQNPMHRASLERTRRFFRRVPSCTRTRRFALEVSGEPTWCFSITPT